MSVSRDSTRQRLRARLRNAGVCLVMIVRNESRIIERLLDSVCKLVQMVSIVDTGSTDDTERLILEWGRRTNVPTKVHHEPFRNFEHNRTHSLRVAKQSFPRASYFLLSDADFVWQGQLPHASLLLQDEYEVEQRSRQSDGSWFRYWNKRLLRSDRDWECEGVTHEYWRACDEERRPVTRGRITMCHILDEGDGGCKTDKFARDERLLREALADPCTKPRLVPRYQFYLAQTLRDLGKDAEAIVWYAKRVQQGGFAEEVYYAQFQVGVLWERLAWRAKEREAGTDDAQNQPCSCCLEPDVTQTERKADSSDATPEPCAAEPATESCLEASAQSPSHDAAHCFAQAKRAYAEAHRLRPTRAEALHALTKLHRVLGEHERALELALQGKDIRFPQEDGLFLDEACYTYLFDLEISIVAYYVEAKRALGYEACVRLLQRDDLGPATRRLCERNSQFYV